MQILIIGCGYLGRRVAAIFQSAGNAVVALTRSPDHAAALKSFGIEPVLGDVVKPSSLQSLPPADLVLYAVGYDRNAAASKREVYVQGLKSALSRLAGRTDRFFYVSSTSVHGQDDGEWINENSPAIPSSEDGRICLDAEAAVRSHFGGSSRATILRLSGIYGPGRLLRRIETIRGGDPIRANPDGFLNLVHVDDAARIVAALAARDQLAPLYLVSDNRPVRRRDYYTRLAQLVGADLPVFEHEVTGRDGLNKRCSNALIRGEVGEIFQFPSFEEGLPDAITNAAAVPPP